jgi:hypothetical protein
MVSQAKLRELEASERQAVWIFIVFVTVVIIVVVVKMMLGGRK